MGTINHIGSEIRTARKEHYCRCGRLILRGEKYLRMVSVIENEYKTILESLEHSHDIQD